MINLFQIGQRGIRIISRDLETKKRIIQDITDFYPYMYIPHSENIPNDDNTFYDVFGHKVRRIFYINPKEISVNRDKYGTFIHNNVQYRNARECEILYNNRFLIDRMPKIPRVPIRKLCLDIEIMHEFDLLKTGKIIPDQEITCITFHDNFKDKIITLLQHPDKNLNLPNTLIYNDEKELLKRIIQFIEYTDPDIFLGWNLSSFDMWYISERCKVHNIDFGRLSMNKWFRIDKFNSYLTGREETEIVLAGRYSFDLLRAYKYIYGSSKSASLEAVGQRHLQEGKHSRIKDFKELWEKHPDELVKYNQQDVLLTVKIDEKLNLFETFNERRLDIGCQWRDLWETTKYHDIALLRRCKERNMVAPSVVKTQYNKVDRIKGGAVADIIPGLHKAIVVLDFKGLYPSIIQSYNVGSDVLKEGMFANNRISIINDYITDIMIERKLFKNQRYSAKLRNDYMDEKRNDLRQYNKKIQANSLFGCLDYHNFRWHNKFCSSFITAKGRELIEFIIKEVKKLNYIVVGSDTDSCFIEFEDDPPINEIIERGKQLCANLNKLVEAYVLNQGCKENYIELEFEYIAKGEPYSAFFGVTDDKDGTRGAKKRYVMWKAWEGGKMIEPAELFIKGFEVRRFDSAPIAKELQVEIFKKILAGAKRDELMLYVHDIKKKLQNREYEANQYAIPKTLKKGLNDYKTNTPVVRGIKHGQSLGIKYNSNKVKMIYTKGSNDVICYQNEEDLPENLRVDWDRMFVPLIDNKLRRMLSALGMDKEQKSMGIF